MIKRSQYKGQCLYNKRSYKVKPGMFFTIVLLLSGMMCLAQQKNTISGYIKDVKTGEVLIGSTIYIQELSTGTVANSYGFYSLTIPQGDYNLIFSYIGYKAQTVKVPLAANQRLDIQLEEDNFVMNEVVVTATKIDENVKSLDMGMSKLDIRTIQKMPSLLGEVDVIRSIQLLPGVSTIGEGAAGFNVRGGSIDHNLILLDESPIYNSSHLFGLFSVFNPDAVKDVKLIKGGIPAQYGGRLASLLDVRMKEGNSKNFTATGGIGTVSSRLALEGPIVKDKSSFIVAGRRSYADLFLKLSPDSNIRDTRAYFYDLSTKVNFKINDKNTIYASGYFGRDLWRFGKDFEMGWGNGTGTVRWNKLFNSRLFANFTGVYSDFDYKLGVPEGSQAFEWKSHIISNNLKADFTYYLNTNNTIDFGASSILYRFKPGEAQSLNQKSIFDTLKLENQHALENGFYVDNKISLNDRLSLSYGLRFSLYYYLGPHTEYDYVGDKGKRKSVVDTLQYGSGKIISTYNNLEPRLSLNYNLTESSSLKFSYNRMAQYIHLISNTTASIPFDVWSATTRQIKPELADQVALGYFKNFKENTIESSVEVYYKDMQNQIDYVDGAELFLNKNLEAEILFGKGRSYGMELYVKKNIGKLTGWTSYTLSRTEKKILGINNDKYYSAKYDKTHNLSVVGIYQVRPRLSLSANFAFSTGIALTVPNSKFVYEGIVNPHNTTEARNFYRIPDYHRLDLSATLDARKKPGKKYESSWVFSVYNAYKRRNTFGMYFREKEDSPGETEVVRLAVFGTILPSITYNFKF